MDFFHSDFQNCSQDTAKILNLHVDSVQRFALDSPTSPGNPDTQGITIFLKDCDYHLHYVEKNSIRYICGYLMRKCLDVHNCATCLRYANEHDYLDEPGSGLIF